MQPDSAAFLWDALDAVKAVHEFTADTDFEGHAGDLKLRSAVERQFEILGEALNNLRKSDPAAAARVPEIEKIIGMRNVIAHEFGRPGAALGGSRAPGAAPARRAHRAARRGR